MKQLVRWAAKLYPAAWRARYGAEFEALLEDSESRGSDVWDVLREASMMQMTRVSFTTISLAFALLGGLLAGVWTLAAFSGYSSTGRLRAAWNEPEIEAQIALTQAMQQALSRASLAEIMQRPGLQLYAEERRTMPLEDVIGKMRRDITVRSERIQDGRFTVSVSVRNTDAALAQKTADVLMERLRNELAATAPVTVQAAAPAQATLEGKRGKLVAMGMLGGLAAGMLLGLGWSVVQNRERWNLRRIGGFAAAGTAVGLVVAFLIPNQYISTAVLRARHSGDPEALLGRVMSEESLSAIVRQEGLYKRELEKASMADVVRRMKAKSLRVQMVDGPVNSYVISFQDGDPVMAQRGTRALVAAWMRANAESGSRVIEVLDPASYPGSPSYPNRGVMVGLGLLGGLVVGLAGARFRRRAEAVASV